jgi:hypothetical protein
MATTRTYSNDAERVRALEAAQKEYRRTGVLRTPISAALARHEARRYPRLPGTAPLPAPPTPTVRDDQVAAIIQEAVAMRDDAAAQHHVAQRLRELGADDVVIDAMRRVQDEREHDARAFEAGDQRAAAALHRLRSPFQSPRSPLVW